MSIGKHIKEHAMLGAPNFSAVGNNTLTVGANGEYATIQAAIDYIEAQDAFTEITMHTNGTVNAWLQGTRTMSMTTTATTAAGQFIPNDPFQSIWIQAAGDTYLYPLESADSVAISQSLGVRCRRHEANASGTPTLTWYRENVFTIKILDDYIRESLTISENANIVFAGNGRTILELYISRLSNFVSGSLTFANIHIKSYAGGMLDSVDANTIILRMSNCICENGQDDFLLPTTVLGGIYVDDLMAIQTPQAVQGHYIAPGTIYGDVIINNVMWSVTNTSAIGGIAGSNAALVDNCQSADKVVINGVWGYISDPHDSFVDISVYGTDNTKAIAPDKLFLSDCHLISEDMASGDLSILRYSTLVAGAESYLDDCSIIAPNANAVKLVSLEGALAGACTCEIGLGNTTIDCDSTANMTYTHKPAPIAGAAIMLSTTTSIIVTHVLGYTPTASRINIMPTLLSNAASWWVTAIGATTFTINVNADPGAGTATFEWSIK